jgi:hypothetical protein
MIDFVIEQILAIAVVEGDEPEPPAKIFRDANQDSFLWQQQTGLLGANYFLESYFFRCIHTGYPQAPWLPNFALLASCGLRPTAFRQARSGVAP